MNSESDTRLSLIGSHLSSYLNVKKKAVDVLGEKVSYLERGEGSPVVLLHGFSCNKSNWRGVINQFPSREYRIIAPDLPGFCLTNINPDLSYSGRFFVDWLDGFLDSVGVRSCHLLSHSTAALVALYFSAERNQRIESLALANLPDFFLPSAGEHGGIIDQFFDSINVNSADEWYQSFSRLFYRPPSIPKVLREYNYNIYAQKLKLAEGFFQACQNMRPQIMVKATQVDKPVLLITSEYDTYGPISNAEHTESNFKYATTFHMPNCGHMSFLEKQSDFNRGYTDFIRRVDASSSQAICKR